MVIEGTNATVFKFVAGSANSYIQNLNIKVFNLQLNISLFWI